MKTNSIQKMTTAALLIAIGVVIPMFSPLKIQLEPASYTLASHVPIFIAMFISPLVAIGVAVGTTVGFFLGGFPIVVVLRAASHVVFAGLGAYFLKRFPNSTLSGVKLRVFSFIIGLVHALMEVLVVSAFYFGGSTMKGGYVYTVLILVGIGGLIHSMVDFEIAWLLTRVISKNPDISKLFANVHLPSPKMKPSHSTPE